jgi:hypothetical protein
MTHLTVEPIDLRLVENHHVPFGFDLPRPVVLFLRQGGRGTRQESTEECKQGCRVDFPVHYFPRSNMVWVFSV